MAGPHLHVNNSQIVGLKAGKSSLINFNPLKIHEATSSRALSKLQLGKGSYRLGTNSYLLPVNKSS